MIQVQSCEKCGFVSTYVGGYRWSDATGQWLCDSCWNNASQVGKPRAGTTCNCAIEDHRDIERGGVCVVCGGAQ